MPIIPVHKLRHDLTQNAHKSREIHIRHGHSLICIPVLGPKGPIDPRQQNNAVNLANGGSGGSHTFVVRNIYRLERRLAGQFVDKCSQLVLGPGRNDNFNARTAHGVGERLAQTIPGPNQPVALTCQINLAHAARFISVGAGRMVATSSATFSPYLRNCERFTMVPFGARYIQSTVSSTWPPALSGSLNRYFNCTVSPDCWPVPSPTTSLAVARILPSLPSVRFQARVCSEPSS
mmetsp:Transcript_18403/g.29844  ORF Transcript_18403/g.29844 Transcript_18403/m.29844 type:complete len:234 (-) Transcript_18403:10042-10743(-)